MTTAPARGWAATTGHTTLVLVRHGVTAMTAEKRFSGGLASANPPLSEAGRAQIQQTAEWIRPLIHGAAALVASPVARTWESGEILAERLGLSLAGEPGFAEMEFGDWDGLTFAEVAEQHPESLNAWLGTLDVAPPGGESFLEVQARVLAGLSRVRSTYNGQTVVVASHVTPIKTIVAAALGAPLESVFRMELSPASVTVVGFDATEDPDASATGWVRLFNGLPPERAGAEFELW